MQICNKMFIYEAVRSCCTCFQFTQYSRKERDWQRKDHNLYTLNRKMSKGQERKRDGNEKWMDWTDELWEKRKKGEVVGGSRYI